MRKRDLRAQINVLLSWQDVTVTKSFVKKLFSVSLSDLFLSFIIFFSFLLWNNWKWHKSLCDRHWQLFITEAQLIWCEKMTFIKVIQFCWHLNDRILQKLAGKSKVRLPQSESLLCMTFWMGHINRVLPITSYFQSFYKAFWHFLEEALIERNHLPSVFNFLKTPAVLQNEVISSFSNKHGKRLENLILYAWN